MHFSRARPLCSGRVGGDQWLPWAAGQSWPDSGCSCHDQEPDGDPPLHYTALQYSHSVSTFSPFLASLSPALPAGITGSAACLTPALASPSCMPSLALLTGRALWEPAAPVPHPSCHSLKLHPWVTRHGAEPLPSEDENCTLVEVTEEEVENSVKHIPSLATVVRREGPLTKSRNRERLRQG